MLMSQAATASSRPVHNIETLSPVPRPHGLAGALAAPVLGMGMAIYDHIVGKLADGSALVSGAKLHARAVDAAGAGTSCRVCRSAAMTFPSKAAGSASSATTPRPSMGGMARHPGHPEQHVCSAATWSRLEWKGAP
jgi:hypothetical protein